MLFLILSNVNILFIEKKLTWRSYTTTKNLSTTKQVKFINKKEFTKVVLDKNFKTFIVYVIFLTVISVYPDKNAQITSLLNKKVKILDEYLDFVDVFSKKKALVLPECTKLNKYAINLEDNK